MRVLVCGGRDFYDWRLVCLTLYEVFKGKTENVILEGGAAGADSLARQFAIYEDIPFEEYPADWKKLGYQAGILRNLYMLEKGKPDLVIAFPGGKGTAHMVKIAKEANVEVREII
jgi:hypothetical protein